MRSKILIAICFTLFLLIIATASARYEPEEPSVDTNLTKFDYAITEPLQGFLTIDFQDPVQENTEIQFRIDNKIVEQINLTDLLAKLDREYESQEEIEDIGNPENSKTFTFSGPGYKDFAFKIVHTINDVKTSMSASGSNSPMFPYINVVPDDNFIEWYYLGSRTGWGDTIKSENYPGGGITSSLDIKKGFFCSELNLTYGRDFLLRAKYKTINQTANASLVVFQYEKYQNGPSYTISNLGYVGHCDLPNPSSMTFQECSINLPAPFGPIKDLYLVCFRAYQDEEYAEYGSNNLEVEHELYQLSAETVGGGSGFSCEAGDDPLEIGEDDSCPNTGVAYNIEVKEPIYNGALPSLVSFKDFFTTLDMHPDPGASNAEQLANDSISARILSFVSMCSDAPGAKCCDPDPEGFCLVPASIHSSSSGTVTLSNLEIKYTNLPSDNKFYDLVNIPRTIFNISDTDLSKTRLNFTIPYSFFTNLTAPNISYATTSTLKISFSPGPTETLSFKTYPQLPKTRYELLTNQITQTKTIYTEFEKVGAETLSLLEIDIVSAKTQLTTLLSQVNALESSNKTPTQKETELDQIEGNYTSLVAKYPKLIYVSSEASDTVLATPSDIGSILPSGTETAPYFSYQSKATTTINAKAVRIEPAIGSAKTKTIVKVTTTPKTSLENVDLYLKIPKTFAQSESDITFTDTSYNVVESDPVIKFHFSALSTEKTITFMVDSDKLSSAMGSKVILIPDVLPVVTPTVAVATCGDDVCTIPLEDKINCPEDCGGQVPWKFIIVLIIILVLGGLLYFYKGDIMKIFIKHKAPFKTQAEFETLRKYIKEQLAKGYNKEQITKTLLMKKWTQPQVLFVFDNLNKNVIIPEKKEKPVKPGQPQRKPNKFLVFGWKSQPKQPR